MQLFENDWLTYTYEQVPGYPHQTRLNWTINDNVVIPVCSPIESIINSVRRMDFGNNPIVALSGGVDSQAVCLMLKAAGINFTTATMVYEDNLNSVDVKNAKLFCEKHNISNTMVDINVTEFLRKKLYDYVIKYECPSPQFCTHFFFYEYLIEHLGATSIMAGGGPPLIQEGKLIFVITRSMNAWTNFVKVNNFKLYGNFLAYSFDIASQLIIARPKLDIVNKPISYYISKCKSFQLLGLDIIPQLTSMTGFEEVKKVFEKETGDGWAFEKMFRHPHRVLFDDNLGTLLPSYIAAELIKLNNTDK